MSQPSPDERPEYTPQQARHSMFARRRQKIIDEIERNRRGDYTVPTWVLTVALGALLAAIAALVIFG